MITLPITKYGTKRKAIISGFAQWNDLNKNAEALFYVQLIDVNGNLLDDKSINQNRAVVYSLINNNRVDANFNPVESGGTGEYDYFFDLVMQDISVVKILIQLATKLNERGIFN